MISPAIVARKGERKREREGRSLVFIAQRKEWSEHNFLILLSLLRFLITPIMAQTSAGLRLAATDGRGRDLGPLW